MPVGHARSRFAGRLSAKVFFQPAVSGAPPAPLSASGGGACFFPFSGARRLPSLHRNRACRSSSFSSCSAAAARLDSGRRCVSVSAAHSCGFCDRLAAMTAMAPTTPCAPTPTAKPRPITTTSLPPASAGGENGACSALSSGDPVDAISPHPRDVKFSDLLENNRRWAARVARERPGFFETLAKQQNPELMWIGCSDSRVPANQLLKLLPGEVFVHRYV
ncbi:MAG: hypothetical protein BJ554DRAFT_8344 [Olpidium bornovanus]|uniref:Carbonic anhydrase n=1 Tax=Olpidium bornovanus TaxID=278681 RepID=A0A8H7ZUG9_9FUNG|nr:MAG: hypothetical protein BJ554DRAFT_8344 [Olpidium bornovanus]